MRKLAHCHLRPQDVIKEFNTRQDNHVQELNARNVKTGMTQARGATTGGMNSNGEYVDSHTPHKIAQILMMSHTL